MLLVRQARHALGMPVNTDSATVCLSDMDCRVLEEVRIRVAPLRRLAEMLIDRTRFWGRHRYGVGPERPVLLWSEVPGDAAAAGAAMLPLREAFFS